MKTQKISWKVRIANAIMEMETIDMDNDDGGYPTIHWLIAKHILRDYTEYEKQQLICEYANTISRNILHAINFIKEVYNKNVYRDIDKKRLQYITLNEENHLAKESDYLREKKLLHNRIKATVKNVQQHSPERLKNLQKESVKLLVS